MDKDKFKVVPVYGTVPNPLRQETQLQETNTFDLATLNLQQCVVNLKRHVDTKPSRFLFLRRRNNEKIKLETAKVNLLIEHIQSLIQLGRHVSDLKAEAILSGEVLRNLIDGKRIEFEHSLNIQLENNLREINAIHVDIKLNNLEVMTKEIEIELKRAEIRAMDASTTKDMAEAQALLAFIKHVETLPDELRTYAWTQYHRRDSSTSGFEEPQDIETKNKKRGFEQTYYEKEKDNVAYDSSKKKAEAEAFVAKMKKTKEIIEKKKKMSDYELSFGTLDVTQFEKPLPEIYDLDKRFNHTYIIGKTGKGKSTLMENMALYDINFGLSVIFIDPSGVSCRKIYQNIEDKDRVIYISIEQPKVINPIHKEGYKLDILIQEFIQILDVLITLTASNPESTVMMRLIIGHAMRAISREDQKNIQFINDLLLNRETRKALSRQLEQEKRQHTEEYRFWNTFDLPANWQRSESAQRVAARLSEISSGEMKQFTIGKNELDIETIVRNKKVILVDTSRMTKNSKIYLTNLLVYAVYSYALFSENMFVKNPDPLLVYVDEFSIVVSDLFDELLATTRKQSIGFVLAHQNFSQIPKNILDTVMGVVDTMVTFACGDTEAKRFSEIYDVKPRELMDLQPYSAWIRLGNENILTDLYEPIIDYVPPLPESIVSPAPVDPDTEFWFLADEKDSWISLS